MTAADPARASSLDRDLLDVFRREVEVHAGVLAEALLRIEAGDPAEAPLERAMRSAHSIKGAARMLDLGAIVALAHTLEDGLVAAQRGELRLGEADLDVLLQAADALAGLVGCDDTQLVALGTAPGPSWQSLLDRLQALGSALAPRGASAAEGEECATPAAVPTPAEPLPARATAASEPLPEARWVKVTTEHLDALLGLAGTLLTEARWHTGLAQRLRRAHSRPRRSALHPEDALATLIDEVDGRAARTVETSYRLHDCLLRCRMRPFADLAAGLERKVRDLARALGKKVVLEVDGAATPVDRDILGRLEAPLNHLLSNAIDHGIEEPEQRARLGKPPAGKLRLAAAHRDGRLLLSVSDDGHGIDPQAIRAAVVGRGLAAKELAAGLGEGELLDFLFLPGFSLRSAVSAVSGRGVGLDVVRDAVRQVRGEVGVRSELGRGTTFDLRLPVTLSLVRALLCTADRELYAFPAHRVHAVLAQPAAEARTLDGVLCCRFRGQHLPLVPLRSILGSPGSGPAADLWQVVVLPAPAGPIGVVVDAFAGEQPLVVQRLPPLLGRIDAVGAGATLDDGRVVLILDVDELADRARDTLTERGAGPGTAATASPRTRRILVVDDSLTVREVERKLLEAHGYQVEVAVDGAAACSRLAEQSFDLVLTDVDMPRMDGIELVGRIKQDPRTRELPVGIISYKDRPQDRRRGLDAGADFYMTKSCFHDDTLLAKVAELVERRP